MAGNTDDLPPHTTIVSMHDTAARAAIAAKLKLATKVPMSKLLNSNSSSNSNRRTATSSNNNTNSNTNSSRTPVSSSNAKRSTERKLLHWSADEWTAYEKTPALGKLVSTARILPMRCPLSSLYEIHVSQPRALLSPSAFMEQLIAASRTSNATTSVATVIDATNNDAFLYDTKEWDDWDVEFVKLRVASSDSDSENQTLEALATAFCHAVETHKSSDLAIGVYGANGYSTIGFLIVSYLVEYCHLALDAALQEVAAAAPPGVYDPQHMEQLYRKYFTTLSSPTMRLDVPSPPAWLILGSNSKKSRSEPLTIGTELLTEEDYAHKFVRSSPPVAVAAVASSTGSLTTPTATSNNSTINRPTYTAPAPVYKPPLYIPPDRLDASGRPAKRRKIRSWVDDVQPLTLGEMILTDSIEYKQVTTALAALTGHAGFPGCETIPLTATHIADRAFEHKGCLTKNYLVTWRARGHRCLLYVSKFGTFVVSRDMTLTKVAMKFPRKRAPTEAQVNTLIDGLIVQDADATSNTNVARYLAFDLVFLDNAPIWQQKLEKRLQSLQNEVILARKHDTTFDYAKEPFRVRMKDHFKLVKTSYLLEKFVASVTHDVDGVIYTPTDAPYNLAGYESDAPIFKFVASETGCGVPGLDGSISARRLLSYIHSIPIAK